MGDVCKCLFCCRVYVCGSTCDIKNDKVLQCVALCVAVCCSVCCSVVQVVAVCCSVLCGSTCDIKNDKVLQCVAVCVAVCCSVCCSVLQCVAACCSVLRRFDVYVPTSVSESVCVTHAPDLTHTHSTRFDDFKVSSAAGCVRVVLCLSLWCFYLCVCVSSRVGI